MSTAADGTMRRWLTHVESTATIATVAASSLLVVAALFADGRPAAGSAGLGAGAALIFFALGAFIDASALRRANPLAGAVVIGSYGVRLAALTIVAMWLAGTPLMASVPWFGAGVASAAMAWVVGMIVGHVNGRWPIYDVEYPRTGASA